MNADEHSSFGNRRDALLHVPVKNPEITSIPFDSGALRLSYPICLKPWFSKIAGLFGKSAENVFIKQLDLDLIGARVWEMIDNQTSVLAIIQQFSAEYKISYREAEVSITSFLRELGKRGLIAMNKPR